MESRSLENLVNKFDNDFWNVLEENYLFDFKIEEQGNIDELKKQKREDFINVIKLWLHSQFVLGCFKDNVKAETNGVTAVIAGAKTDSKTKSLTSSRATAAEQPCPVPGGHYWTYFLGDKKCVACGARG